MLTVVLAGPESAGKSTLAASLAAAFGAPMVGEYARAWLAAHGPDYREADLQVIAAGQHAAERAVRAPLRIVDTDLVHIELWARVRYGRVAPCIRRRTVAYRRERRYYLLCCPDLPWQPDPLRDRPELRDRAALWSAERDLLDAHGLDWCAIAGTGPARAGSARAAIVARLARG